ncbi:MAG TPA: DegT/DnrJ/EryC1/StrS aminotransferase family protein [Bryobacteraceae bacterium]|nr:DegT/DnrJ/EryC1/StrS aminotransferase family protein [Bryobacteraceae bacterium]
MKDTNFIPFHLPSIGEEEIQEVTDTLRSGWLTTGPRVARFEREFANHVGASYTVAVNSATAALHLALAALKIGPGDEVITTPITFCSTVQVILHVGATPVLADIGCDGNIDPDAIESCITSRTRAIIPVHLAGLPCDMARIWTIARKRGIHVIEDAAHATGAHYEDRPVGAGRTGDANASDAVAFSFYATKNMTTGEGGMIATPWSSLAETMRMLALHGTSHGAWDRYTRNGNWHYEVVAHGFKYNLSDINAAIGIHQLAKVEKFTEVRARYAAIYNRAFAEMPEVEIPPDKRNCRHAWHLYILRLNLPTLRITRDEFIHELRQKGIGTSVHFIPIPLHPFFAQLQLGRQCCRALELYPRVVSLPLYPAMSEEQVCYVAECVKDVLERARQVKFAGSSAVAKPGSDQVAGAP